MKGGDVLGPEEDRAFFEVTSKGKKHYPGRTGKSF
jgi:hypothetical protein